MKFLWSKQAERKLLELAHHWVPLNNEGRVVHGAWVRVSRELQLALDEYHPAQSCRQKYYEKMRPGISIAPMEPWEDDILIKAREERLSFAYITRTLLPHRSERTLVNRTRSPTFKRYARAKQFSDALVDAEEEISIESDNSATITHPPPLMPLDPLLLFPPPSDHHCHNES